MYPTTASQSATYDNLNQLTNLSGQAIAFDAVGNVTSDGTRTYTWDAENRLVGIAYPGVSGKATAFTYDGLGRRVTIASTPAGGGSATTTSYLWCGSVICQARNSSNTTSRSYYDEGELMYGTPNQPYYYGIDQIGSVRRAFASTSSAPAYSYDPYGVPLQATAPVTDFVYGGMFFNSDSGLYLTKYRTYDSISGRWLSRDPLGEITDPVGNLYPYVGGNPIGSTDTSGLLAFIIPGLLHPTPSPPSPAAQDCALASNLTSFDDQPSGSPNAGSPMDDGPALAADNQRQNKQVRDIVVQLGLTPEQQQLLHREITGQGYTYKQILETAKSMFGK